MPSWVPNWQVLHKTEFFEPHSASGGSLCRTRYYDNILSVSGVRIATVREIKYVDIVEKLGKSPVINAIRRIATFALEKDYVDGGSILDAYLHTLCRGNFTKRYEPPSQTGVNYEISKQCLFTCLNTSYIREKWELGEEMFLEVSRKSFENYSFLLLTRDTSDLGRPQLDHAIKYVSFLAVKHRSFYDQPNMGNIRLLDQHIRME